jgi:DNA-binding response OmpR family regulator
VLLVTTDVALAEALGEALAVWNFSVIHTTTTQAAVHACEVAHPSIVLVDLLGDGRLKGLAPALRSTFGRETPPLIVLAEEPPYTRRGEDVIAVQTPFLLEDLRAALDEACRDGRMLLH